MTPYLIMGAGAVGSALGAYLARQGHKVTLIAREPHTLAIARKGGLEITTYDESFLAPLAAASAPPEALPEGTVILLTVQAPDVLQAVTSLSDLPRHHVLVTFQNGIRAEEDAAPLCERLYGGIVRFTSTMLEPGKIRLRRPGDLIVGRDPRGVDDTARQLAADFAKAGFRCALSPEIRVDKMLKLAVNLVSGPAVLMRRTQAEPALARVQTALLQEAKRVFQKTGVRAEALSGTGKSLDDMIRQFQGGGSAPDGREVYNSTWQNLHHRRPRLENRYYHGEIMALGERCKTPTPVNARVLELLEEALAAGLGPEPYSPQEFEALFSDIVDMRSPIQGNDAHDPTLEI